MDYSKADLRLIIFWNSDVAGPSFYWFSMHRQTNDRCAVDHFCCYQWQAFSESK